MFRVNSMLPLDVIAKKRFSFHLTFDLWTLTFSSGGLRDTSSHPRASPHQVWRKSVQPFRRSFWHKNAQRIYIWPFITWPLTSVTMATSYFDNTWHFRYTWKVSCQFNVFLWSYSQKTIFTYFDLWPLTFDLWFRKSARHKGPPQGTFPPSLKKIGPAV